MKTHRPRRLNKFKLTIAAAPLQGQDYQHFTATFQEIFGWSIALMFFYCSTYVGHLWYHGNIGFIGEDRRVVIDVLHSDDELRGGLQGSASLAVCSGCNETVLVLLLTVQRLGDMYVACVAVDNKHRAHSLSFQQILSAAVSLVHICVQLEK